MRIAFGLIGLLVVIGVIVMIMSTILEKEQVVISAGSQAREQVTQIGGYSEDQTPAQNSATFEAQDVGGRFDTLLVTNVVKGGAMDKFYGLKVDDVIVDVNGMKLREFASGDPDMAKELVIKAFTASQPIVVLRDGKRVTLPLDKAAPVTGAAPAAQPAPAQSSDPLQRQLDAIEKVPTH